MLILAFTAGGAVLLFVAAWDLSASTRCSAISDTDAIARADWRLRDSFGDRPDAMLEGRTASQLQARDVVRDRFGNTRLDSTNVHFVDRSSGRAVIVARIFTDCDIEWRPVREPAVTVGS